MTRQFAASARVRGLNVEYRRGVGVSWSSMQRSLADTGAAEEKASDQMLEQHPVLLIIV